MVTLAHCYVALRTNKDFLNTNTFHVRCHMLALNYYTYVHYEAFVKCFYT